VNERGDCRALSDGAPTGRVGSRQKNRASAATRAPRTKPKKHRRTNAERKRAYENNDLLLPKGKS
jgi:hypothetical protein